jgi:LEA14-like dessication related protein
MKIRILLPLLGALIFTGCKKVKDPEFRRVGHFKVKNLDIQDVTIGFNVTYFNPNNFGVTVKEAVADVYIDSVYWGKFEQDSSIAVTKNAEFSIPLSGKISLSRALQMDLKNLGQRLVAVKADGSVKVGKAGIFVTKPFRYEGKHSLNEISIQ